MIKSLVIVRRQQGRETHYFLLETIRQYAQDRFIEAGQVEIYRSRHLNFFLDWGEKAEQALVGSEQVVADALEIKTA